MSSVLNRTTGQFLQSVHTPNFPVADWIINPDLTAVAGQPSIYWVITGDIVSLASVGEQATIDAAIIAAQLTSEKDAAKNQIDVERVVRALIELLPSEFNILRTLHSLPDRNTAGLVTAIKANIDAQA